MEKSKFAQKFIQSYNDDSDKWYILKVDVSDPDTQWSSIFPCNNEYWQKKNKKKTNKLWKKEKKKNYVVIIKISKQALDYGLILEKVYKVTQFSQEACLRPYIDMNVELSKKVKNDFEFGKSVERLWQCLGKLWWIWGITWASNLWRLTKEEMVQLVPDVPWASCNGLMMVLTPVTCRGPSGD